MAAPPPLMNPRALSSCACRGLETGKQHAVLPISAFRCCLVAPTETRNAFTRIRVGWVIV